MGSKEVCCGEGNSLDLDLFFSGANGVEEGGNGVVQSTGKIRGL